MEKEIKGLLQLAQEKGQEDPGFYEWFVDRHEGSGLHEHSQYRVGELMRGFLGLAGPGYYQYWEANAESLGYPVPFPVRAPLWANASPGSPASKVRTYTPVEFVAVAYWWWVRNVRDEKEVCVAEESGV